MDNFANGYNSFIKRYFPIFAGLFLVVAGAFTFFKVIKSKKNITTSVIYKDIKDIASALKMIDDSCNILSIRSDKNKIDFLVVKEFSGSEIGGLNLAHPGQWGGPYFEQNPSIDGVYYNLVHAKDGYYVVPGDSVKLSNGYTVGEDFLINHDSDIDSMFSKDGFLYHKGVQLGIKLDFVIGDWDFSPKNAERFKKVNISLQEFNAAMPYTYNSTTEIYV